MQSNKVIVLGGSGFLGANLCKALEMADAVPIVLDKADGCDLATDHGQRMFMSALNSVGTSAGIDIVMMAARLGADLFDHSPFEPFNENKAINEKCISTMLEFYGKTRFQLHTTFYSTSEVYGNVDPMNIPNKRLPSIDPSYSRSLYAQEKLMTETQLSYLRSIGAIASHRTFRPFNVSGLGQRRGVMYKMVESAVKHKKILYAPDQTREITFVQDATDMALQMILSRREGTFDLTSKFHVRLEDLAKSIRLVAGIKGILDSSEVSIEALPIVDTYIKTRGTTNVLSTEKDLEDFVKALASHNTIESIIEGI